MTPKEKALELISKYTDTLWNLGISINKQSVIQCALIGIDEIIKTDCLIDDEAYVNTTSYLAFWQKVKTELKNL